MGTPRPAANTPDRRHQRVATHVWKADKHYTECKRGEGVFVVCFEQGSLYTVSFAKGFLAKKKIGSERLCFWGAPHIFQIKYSVKMSGNVDLLKTWEGTTTLLMWLWPVRMISRWKLTRWSWLGRYSFIDYFTVIITSRSLLRSRQEAAAGRWWSSQPGQG